MKKAVWTLAAAWACAAPALMAQSVVVEMDPARTEIHWTLGGTLHTVHGTFALKRGSIRIDPATGKAGGEIVVDTTSGQSGNGPRDHRMHKEILESAKYPETAFTPDRVEGKFDPLAAAQKVDLHGTMRIHGASHEMTMHLDVKLANGQVEATCAFTVPYLQWGLKNPSNFLLKVDDHVDVEIKTAGKLTAAGA